MRLHLLIFFIGKLTRFTKDLVIYSQFSKIMKRCRSWYMFEDGLVFRIKVMSCHLFRK